MVPLLRPVHDTSGNRAVLGDTGVMRTFITSIHTRSSPTGMSDAATILVSGRYLPRSKPKVSLMNVLIS